MLTELEEEKNRLVSHLSMLIHVTSESGILTSGELTTHGMYYQLSVQLTNHASDFKLTEKLVKALVEIGKGVIYILCFYEIGILTMSVCRHRMASWRIIHQEANSSTWH